MRRLYGNGFFLGNALLAVTSVAVYVLGFNFGIRYQVLIMHIVHGSELRHISFVIVFIDALVLFIAIFGAWISYKVKAKESPNRGRLLRAARGFGIYLWMVLLIILGIILLMWLSTVYFGHAKNTVGDDIKYAMYAYRDDENMRRRLDALHMAFRCCGINNYKDWIATKSKKLQKQGVPVPATCCMSKSGDTCTQFMPNGCRSEIVDYFNTILPSLLFVGFAQIIWLGSLAYLSLVLRRGIILRLRSK